MSEPKKLWAVMNSETEISHSYHETYDEAKKLADEMSEYHQKSYVVREVPPHIVKGMTEPTEPMPASRPPSLLTEDEIESIRDSVVGDLQVLKRDAIALLNHIDILGARTCQACRWWVAYGKSMDSATKGECTNQKAKSHVRIITVKDEGDAVFTEEVEDESLNISHLTEFDWSCAGYEQAMANVGDDAQACSS